MSSPKHNKNAIVDTESALVSLEKKNLYFWEVQINDSEIKN